MGHVDRRRPWNKFLILSLEGPWRSLGSSTHSSDVSQAEGGPPLRAVPLLHVRQVGGQGRHCPRGRSWVFCRVPK